MKTYKVGIQAYQVVEVQADSLDDVYDKFWDSPAHENSDMFNTEIVEVVDNDKEFELFTDLN